MSVGPMHDPFYNELSILLIEVILILLVVRALGYILHRFRQPIVIGEIIAGVLLGPSAMGLVPGFSQTVFPPDAVAVLSLIASVGLCFFMFFLGLEVDPAAMRKALSSSIPIAVCSIVIPFFSGIALALWLFELNTSGAPFNTFCLFIGTAISFTAFPVLARMLESAKLLQSPLGIRALSCAAVDDLLGWCVLALTLSYTQGGTIENGIYVALIAVAFIVFLSTVVHRFLSFLQDYCMTTGEPVNRNYIAVLFMLLMLSAWFCEVLGVHAFFGAFIFGIAVPKNKALIEELAPKIELLIVEFFLPLYFANSGLKTNLTELSGGHIWAALAVLCVVGSAAKILPVLLVSRWTSPGGLRNGAPWSHCLAFGILMNTRGLVTLIALNIGLEAELIDTRLFSLFVVFSLVTTFATPPLLYHFYEKDYRMQSASLLQETDTGASAECASDHIEILPRVDTLPANGSRIASFVIDNYEPGSIRSISTRHIFQDAAMMAAAAESGLSPRNQSRMTRSNTAVQLDEHDKPFNSSQSPRYGASDDITVHSTNKKPQRNSDQT